MTKHDFAVPPQISMGDEGVVLSRQGQSKKVVADILGKETDPNGMTIWLDRVIHRPGEDRFQQGDRKWHVSGAISTVLRWEPEQSQAVARQE